MIKKRIFHIFSIITLILMVTAVLPPIHAYGNNPDDPKVSDQWGWYNIYTDVAYANGYRGDNTTIVAVIDTGIDLNHPDLAANIFTNPYEVPNGLDDDFNGYIDDIHGWNFVADSNDTSDHDGHGSHCAGIIAGVDNTIGIIGVAPNVKILPVKVIETESGDMGVLAEAINYSRMMGAKIISMSIGTDDVAFPGKTQINIAINIAYASGVVLVAAAGNDGVNDVSYPAAHTNVIAVAATTKSNGHASYSNTGPEIEISAPGGDASAAIISTYNDSNYRYAAGTSMACPHVSGVIALILQWNNTLTPAEIRTLIHTNAIDLGTPGWDSTFGYGLINVAGCLGLPQEHTYDPILGWILNNIWWMLLTIFAVIVIIIVVKVGK